jgi:hypothetical protein
VHARVQGPGTGAFAFDVDEASNRVWVGVRDRAAVAAVLALASVAGVPTDAIAVEVAAPPEHRQTLDDRASTMGGGYAIQNESTYGGCTLGYNTVWNGQPAFVTASHCSVTQFGLDNSVQHQPVVGPGHRIGREVADPGIRRCLDYTYNTYYNCRYSDAAVFAYDAGIPVGQGYIARPIEFVEDRRGSLTIDPNYPWLYIFQKNATWNVPLGQGIFKVGQTSGGTFGRVTRTCVNYLGSTRLFCQNVADLWSEPGDSGSPIHYYSSTVAGEVLHGLLWGGPSTDFNTTWYSPLSGLEKDLGVHKVCISSVSC